MNATKSTGLVYVARYDDDYPLLYGEPAVQPQMQQSQFVDESADLDARIEDDVRILGKSSRPAVIRQPGGDVH
jgi:hypothetical protein